MKSRRTFCLGRGSRRAALALGAALLSWAGLASTAGAATFADNSGSDVSDAMPGDGVCSTMAGVCTLRAAVEEANALSGADVITVPSGMVHISQGEIAVASNVTVNGAGSSKSIVDAGYSSRIFNVTGAVLNISGLRLQRGMVVDDCGGALYVDSTSTLVVSDSVITHSRCKAESVSVQGAGLCNDGQTTLTNVRVRGNRLFGGYYNDGDGGGIENNGDLSLNHTEISQNRITASGGGWEQGAGLSNYGTLNINHVVVAGNRIRAGVGPAGDSSVDGAGIYNEGTITGGDLTLEGNVGLAKGSTYAQGGGLSCFASLSSVTLSGVTATGNRIIAKGDGWGNGAGIHLLGGTAVLDHVTAVGNQAMSRGFAYGGGIDVEDGTLTVTSGFISRNIAKGLARSTAPFGGGVSIESALEVTLTDVVVSYNKAVGDGAADGGISIGGLLTLNNVVQANNTP
ncbi:MAG: hypothetical protein HY270_01165 [Deltaproteobacteria bacterium]|nr:hypothetical protein [Deltaproteobacteria bacterium]